MCRPPYLQGYRGAKYRVLVNMSTLMAVKFLIAYLKYRRLPANLEPDYNVYLVFGKG